MPRDLFADEEPIDLLADEPMKQSNGFLKNALDYEKALGLGLLQGGGDVATSIGNFPADIYKHFKGKDLYHIPHPSLQQYYPEGQAGKIGSLIGETIGQVALPGTSTLKAAKFFNNPLASALSGALAGGASGAASNEEDRLGSGLIGASLGGTMPLISPALNKLGDVLPLTKAIASSPYIKKAEYMKKHGLGDYMYVKPEYLNEARRLMESEGMGVPKEAIANVFPKALAGKHDSIHSVQSTMRSLARELSRKGGVEGELGRDMHSLAEKISEAMNDQFKIMGHGKAAQLENQGKARTAKYYKMRPAKNVAIKGLGGALGLGTGYEFLKHLLSH